VARRVAHRRRADGVDPAASAGEMACRGAAGTFPAAAACPAAACEPAETGAGADRPVARSAARAIRDTAVAARPLAAAVAERADERPACRLARPSPRRRDARSWESSDGRFSVAPDAARPEAPGRSAAAPSASSAAAPRSGDGVSEERGGLVSEASAPPLAEELPPSLDGADRPAGAMARVVSPPVAPPERTLRR
jgi:hypothetical protein